MDWPMKWVYGLVKRNGEVTEFESPAYAWILDVPRWLNLIKERLGENHPLFSLISGIDDDNIALPDESSSVYPLVSWINDRANGRILKAENSWDRWSDYLLHLSIPGESGMEAPALLVDIERSMLYIAPDNRILSMHLEAGIPAGWGWRAVSYEELREIAESEDYVETILDGTTTHANLASIRRAQRRGRLARVFEPATSDDDNNRVKSFISRRRAKSGN